MNKKLEMVYDSVVRAVKGEPLPNIDTLNKLKLFKDIMAICNGSNEKPLAKEMALLNAKELHNMGYECGDERGNWENLYSEAVEIFNDTDSQIQKELIVYLYTDLYNMCEVRNNG